MDRKPFQYSLSGLFILTTACAVLLSFAKTFPNAAVRCLILCGPLLLILGSLLVFRSERFLPQQPRFVWVCVLLLGFFYMIACLLVILLW